MIRKEITIIDHFKSINGKSERPADLIGKGSGTIQCTFMVLTLRKLEKD